MSENGTSFIKNLAENETFHTFILFMILATAISMGLETVPELYDRYDGFFEFFYFFSQAVFAIEITVRLLAHAPNFKKFFSGFWNVFDFTIIALSFVPEIGSFIIIARLFRLVRLLRVFSVSDRLRGFISRLHESLDEIIYSTLILSVLSYIFSIAGFYLFVEIDAERWGTLGRAYLSVFYLALLQDLKSFINPLVNASGFYILYFLIFYLILFGFVLSVINAAISQSRREDK